jgi:hypothetical protein
MNRQQFINYIKSPEQLNEESLFQLENLVKEYPFFQTAETLLAINYQLLGNFKFDDQLKLASAYAADRKLLKHQLKAIQKYNEPESRKETQPIVKEHVVPDKKEHTPDTKSLADLINQLKTEVDLYMIQAPDQKNSKQIAKLHTIAVKLEKLIDSDEKKSTVLEKTKESKQAAPAEYSIEHIEEIPLKKPQQIANAELIDKFIKEEPRIVPKPTFFDPVDSAKQSILDNESVVSETLAEIYYKQGNLSKAIKIYKKLSLVNPQKSTYFAAQIEKIQKEIK